MRFKRFFQQFFLLIKKSRRFKIIFAVTIFLLVVLITLLVLLKVWSPKERGLEITSPQIPKEKGRNYSLPAGIRTIDGMPVEEEEARRRPQAVVIENLATARPQSGLREANLVYEALAEGGITRFLAFHSGVEVEEIGPVRSARVYYLDWVLEFDALFAHCGGDPYALSLIERYGIKDLDQMYNGTFYWRTTQTLAPHNLFTKTKFLEEAMSKKGWEDKAEFAPWIFKEERELEERPQVVKDIKIDFSTYSYQVVWKYDRESNSYWRYNVSVPHIDKNTSEQIRTKNIVVQYMVAKIKDPGSLEGRLGMHTIGGDKALVFRDGEVISGVWKKSSREARTRFYDAQGQEIEFNPGTTWIEVVPPEKVVSY